MRQGRVKFFLSTHGLTACSNLVICPTLVPKTTQTPEIMHLYEYSSCPIPKSSAGKRATLFVVALMAAMFYSPASQALVTSFNSTTTTRAIPDATPAGTNYTIPVSGIAGNLNTVTLTTMPFHRYIRGQVI
jgi:hypothetical protein